MEKQTQRRVDAGAEGGPERRPFARVLPIAFATAVLAASVLAGLASADPIQDAQDPGNVAGDTAYTPVPAGIQAAADIGWRQFAGAVFPDKQVAAEKSMGYVDNEPRLHTVDFYSVAFSDPDHGFAGGAACTDPGATDLEGCPRVPVIYQYGKGDTGAPKWTEVYRGDAHGFVGAIAWIPDENKAVAVGGDGCYPRRDGVDCTGASLPSGEAGKDIAGNGLVWVFENGSWQRTPSQPGMTGMTALAFSPRPPDCGASTECGLAGGRGQVWMWSDREGGFQSAASYQYNLDGHLGTPDDDPRDQPSPSTNPFSGGTISWRTTSPFRVRRLAFTAGSGGDTAAVGVTSGCCLTDDPSTPQDESSTEDPTVNFPRVMLFRGGKWTIGGLYFQTTMGKPDRAETPPDSLYSVVPSGKSGNVANRQFSVVASPGTTEGPAEPTSRIIGPVTPQASANSATSDVATGSLNAIGETQDSSAGTDIPRELATPELASVRLVAADGDLQSHLDTTEAQVTGLDPAPENAPDGVADWAVGKLRASGEAIAYTTTDTSRALRVPYYPLSCPEGSDLNHIAAAPAQCQVDTNPAGQAKSRHLFSLPSYALNAFTMVGKSGVAWAAGDRGALLRLSGSSLQKGAGAVTPPKLSNPQETRLSNRSAYDAFRPVLSTEPGQVPPLAAQPVTELPTGRIVSAGSPNPQPDRVHAESVGAIAMSRDGAEGWAVGPNPSSAGSQRTTLYHFDGVRWTRCDPSGVPGALAADRACASLAELSTLQGSGGSGLQILTIARVPLENGSDQSKADDFEAVAPAADPSGSGVTILRYRDGEWAVDDDWSRQLGDAAEASDLVLTAPDDGWLRSGSGAATGTRLWRLNKDGWSQCLSPQGANHYGQTCFDTDSVLPSNPNTSATQSGPDTATGPFVSGLHLTSLGRRVYLYGTRSPNNGPGSLKYPVIASVDSTADHPKWTAEFDPLHGDQTQGILNSLSLAPGPDGSITGWGLGDFHPNAEPQAAGSNLSNKGHSPLIRLDPATKSWKVVDKPDPAAAEYLLPEDVNEGLSTRLGSERVIALPGGAAIAAPVMGSGAAPRPLVWFNPASDRWEVFPTPAKASVDAMEPDSRGGIWFAVHTAGTTGTWFQHYTASVNSPVFADVPHPIRQPITATAAGGDGSLWATTESGTVYRYDRLTGWDQVNLKGWDSGGAVQSPAYAVAVGPDGEGVVVGKGGRIADVGPLGARLDPAAVLCSSRPEGCGGGRALRAAAVASDGSALVGGDARTLLWRPPGGGFSAIAAPETAASTTITGIAMPKPTQAWLTTDNGDVFAGALSGGDWQWTREDVDASGRLLARDASGSELALHGIAVDADGHGYAVGDQGLILERTGDGPQAWRRLTVGSGEDLHSVAIGPSGKGALIGGEAGLVLTRVGDRLEVARNSDTFDPVVAPALNEPAGSVVGVALLPGHNAGEVEAWAAMQLPAKGANRRPAPGAILHYTSEPGDPLLAAGAGRAKPLPDAPDHVDGEIDFAAFGKSDCQLATGNDICPEFTGSELANEAIARRIRDTLLTGKQRPDFAVFTGDVDDAAGYNNRNIVNAPTDPSRIHERWSELIAGPFARADLPFYGAIGGQDLSNTQACDPYLHSACAGTHRTRTGLNLAWRQAFADADAPWGQGESDSGPLDTSMVPVDTSAVPKNGARTHYAVDMVRGGKKVLRLVVVDTSLKTLSGTAAVQNPVEDQLKWLDDTLSNRDAGELAVVVSETPSYTYGSTGSTTDTLTDSAAFETLLVKNQVTAVVSGRLGWNGLYWIAAPGVHSPCPGQSYQQAPPSDPTQVCQGSGPAVDNADKVAQALQGLGAPAPVPQVPTPSKAVQDAAGNLPAPIPVAVAASSGGKFGPDGSASGSATQGFWHGYTRVRLFPGRDNSPLSMSIEQRPVFDWIGIQASDHSMAPGQRPMRLQGYGREPVGSDQPIRYDDINGPAVTHRYDLVLADPDKPYMPKVDPTSSTRNHYLSLPGIGAEIDQAGVIRYRGRGNHPPVYAVALLSVGDQVATWPVVFQPKRSFTAPPPPAAQRVVLPPPPRVEAATAASLPPTPPSQVPTPPPLNFTFPTAPSLLSPPLSAPSAQPPAPPAPPPPPASPLATALQISPAAVGLTVAPPASVIPPPAPPIQPAPPGGARREARQKQAAVAKSEEGGGDESATQESNGNSGNESASTRLEQRRQPLAFTAVDHRSQPSAWSRDLMYGGGLGLAALTLALGWGLLRPRPRRRQPDLPAPAWVRSQTRRRPDDAR